MPTPSNSVALVLACVLLTACGGGGGGGGGGGSGSGSGAPVDQAAFRVLDLTTGTLGGVVSSVDLAAAENRSTRVVFRRLPAGSYIRGQAAGTFGRDSDETAATVSVDETWMAVFELTRAQWEALAGSGDRPWLRLRPAAVTGASASDIPAAGVTAVALAAALTDFNTRFTPTLAMPSENVWEYACRAGSGGLFAWGDSLQPTTANTHAVTAISGGSGPRAVGGRTANAFGLHDLHGNVREWVNVGATVHQRGGGWSDHLLRCRAANRFRSVDAEYHHALAGVRLVVTP